MATYVTQRYQTKTRRCYFSLLNLIYLSLGRVSNIVFKSSVKSPSSLSNNRSASSRIKNLKVK